MSAHVLDTHRIVKRLQEAGFSDAQAEVVTDVVREAREFDFANLATKADIAALRTEIATLATRAELDLVKADVATLKADVAGLKADMTALKLEVAALRSLIAEGKADTLKWVIGLVLVQGGVVVTLIKLLPGFGH